jgi:GT2 family glycosyltransferase
LKNYVTTLHVEVAKSASNDVTILEVEVNLTLENLEKLALLAESATTPWLFVVDRTVSAIDREAALSSLLAFAHRGEVTYADEIGPRGMLPILKSPSVGPHTLLSYNQIGRPALIPTEALLRVGGIHTHTGVAFEHDIYLRLLEAGVAFTHFDRILPAGRPPSTFDHSMLTEATIRVCFEALVRRGLSGEVRPTEVASVVSWHVAPRQWPVVDIVIPTRDRLDLLRRCLDSLEAVTSYPDYRVTILDNDSVESETLNYLSTISHQVVRCPGPFNYASIINRGVAHTKANFIVTLNNDIVVVTPEWLREMVGMATVGKVGIVGSTQVNGEGVHDHDGIVIAPYPQHLRRGANYWLEDESLFARRDVSAVTGAVQLIRRDVWDELGGMDESLAVVLNDVDLCLRAHVAGYDVVMIPDVVSIHHAGSTRGRLEPLTDRNHFVRRWDVFGELRDPFFSNSLRLIGSEVMYRPAMSDRRR